MRRILGSPAGAAGAALVLGFIVLALLGPPIWGDRAGRIDATAILEGASSRHLLGTDGLGRDILARVLVAGRLSLLLAVIATGIGVVVGVPLGALPSVLPRRTGRFLASTVGALVAFPGLLLAMFTSIVLGLGARGAVFGIGVATAPVLARLTLTLTSSVGGSDYVAAARVLGVSRWRILTRHILPNVAEPVILNITLVLGSALLGLSGLSYLGLGVQPPSYDWGQLLSDGLQRVYVDPAVALGPAVAIMLAGIGFNLLGERMARSAAREASQPSPHTQPLPAPAATTDALPARTGDVLELHHLTVEFPGDGTPVQDVSLWVNSGEIVGLVGESGSGKSLTALAIGGLVPHPGRVSMARHRLAGTDIDKLSRSARRRLLGTSLAMVFQDPMTSLNPALRIGSQLAEVPIVHEQAPRRRAWQAAVDRLKAVHIPDPARRARQRPHQFSGGMRQRAIIAIGLMGRPRLLIADEPTTALDVTVQRQILELLAEVNVNTGVGALFISHDIAVVSQVCHRVVVMYAGRVVEELAVSDLVSGPAHPYTRALVASLPDMRTDRDRPLATIPGRPPSPSHPLPGCPFAPRCEFASDRCRTERPPLVALPGQRRLACWHPQSGPARPDFSTLAVAQ